LDDAKSLGFRFRSAPSCFSTRSAFRPGSFQKLGGAVAQIYTRSKELFFRHELSLRFERYIVIRYNKNTVRRESERSMDYRALADFRYEIRRFLSFSEQAARDSGVEPQQHQALLAIKGLPLGRRPTVGVLSERLQIQHHSGVELSVRLEAKKLIRRVRSRRDRREVLLSLTRRGEQLLRELTLPHRAELRSAGPTLLRALDAVIHMDAYRRSGRKKSERASTKATRPRRNKKNGARG
jgi:DNA-binding MarR family transcriptional regulator